ASQGFAAARLVERRKPARLLNIKIARRGAIARILRCSARYVLPAAFLPARAGLRSCIRLPLVRGRMKAVGAASDLRASALRLLDNDPVDIESQPPQRAHHAIAVGAQPLIGLCGLGLDFDRKLCSA